MKLFIDINSSAHDSSGVGNPKKYYWEKSNGVYYPIREIEESELHEEVLEFLYENENLPNDSSLDEIPLDDFTLKQEEKRDFFMSLF
jgi:hypothetical protein